jgi:hypothetical protein
MNHIFAAQGTSICEYNATTSATVNASFITLPLASWP